MPRGRPPQHTDHPLFKLRELLGEMEPVTQPELAKIIYVPLSTVQSIEAGRRDKQGFTGEMRLRIIQSTGAYWDAEKKQWGYGLRDDFVPFTFDLYCEFREIVTRRPAGHTKEVATHVRQIHELYDTVPDEHWHALWFQVDNFIHDRKAEIAALLKRAKKTPPRTY